MKEFECPGNVNLGVILKEITRGNLVERLRKESGDVDFIGMAEEIEGDASELHAGLHRHLPLQNVINYILGK